jgi:hypothetical protein
MFFAAAPVAALAVWAGCGPLAPPGMDFNPLPSGSVAPSPSAEAWIGGDGPPEIAGKVAVINFWASW